jgi:hypothetical protein
MATAGLVLGYVSVTVSLIYGVLVLLGVGTGVLSAVQKMAEEARQTQPPIEHVTPAK